MSGYIVVFITSSNEQEAEKIAKAVIESRLAACVNIIKNVRSIYRWQGRIEDDNEALMIVKTRSDLFEELLNAVKGLHSYSVPEVIAMPIIEGSGDYLKWLEKETAQKG
ncbi:MAG: divalent-cation tolerance protein CutA [Nitrospirota bacterium]